MRRTLVLIAMLGALGVLVLRIWPSAPEPPQAAVVVSAVPPAPSMFLAADRDTIDEQTCAGPAVREIRKHPHWELRLAEREWDDVVDDTPDPTFQTVRIDEDHATWADFDLPQSLELEPAERADMLAAIERSCVQPELGERDGFSGRYVTVSYGAVEANAITLPSRSPAAVATIAVLDHIRARYVQARLDAAHAMTLTLTGPRWDDDRWRTYTLTVRGDGHIVDANGDAAEPLAAIDLVDTLDWALQLAPKARGKHVLTGTLEIAGSKKKVALQLDDLPHAFEAWNDPLRSALLNWWLIDRDR